MSLLNSIKSIFGAGGVSVSRDANRLYVVDAERLAEGRGGSIGPVERLQSLQRLAQFAAREKIRIVAVLSGRPLREVANGDEFNGVKVYYVEQASAIGDQIAKLCTGSALAVVGDAQTEQKIRSRGNETIKTSTLRKAFSEGGEGGGEQRGDGRNFRRRDRGDRPRRDRGDRGERGGDRGDRGNREPREPREPRATDSQPGEAPQSQQQPQRERGNDQGGGDPSVKSLIDLVE